MVISQSLFLQRMSHELFFNYPRHFSRNTVHIKSVPKEICCNFLIEIGFNDFEHINYVAMYRLSIPKILQDIDKCIYLDSDIVVEGDIAELDGISVEGVCIAGVEDGAPFGEYAERLREILDGPDLDQYINSGVLIMNL